MSRKINPKLLERMTSGNLLPLLKYIKSDNDLRIEVRQGGKAFVYYRKGKALEIGLHTFSVDEKYVRNTTYSIPDMDLPKSNPAAYFKQMKIIIDNYVDNRMKRQEFDVQQDIASCNQGKYDKYIILDPLCINHAIAIFKLLMFLFFCLLMSCITVRAIILDNILFLNPSKDFA